MLKNVITKNTKNKTKKNREEVKKIILNNNLFHKGDINVSLYFPSNKNSKIMKFSNIFKLLANVVKSQKKTINAQLLENF